MGNSGRFTPEGVLQAVKVALAASTRSAQQPSEVLQVQEGRRQGNVCVGWGGMSCGREVAGGSPGLGL